MYKLLFIIALLLCCFGFTATAQDVVVKNVEGPSVQCQGNLHDLMYANKTSGGPSKAKQYANPSEAVVDYRDRISNMPQYLHDFINAYVEAGQTVLNGGSSWLSDPTLGEYTSNTYYYLLDEVTGIAPFSFPRGSSDEVIQQAAYNAIVGHINEAYDVLQSFLPYAVLSLNFDHPEIFWTGKSYQYGYSSGYGYSYYTNGTGTVEFSMKLQFTLLSYSNGFDIRNNGLSGYDFQHPEELAQGVQLFHSSVQNILKNCQTGSRYDKLLAAHDWLTLHNCYNPFFASGEYGQLEIGDTPWSALSALEGNDGQKAPVCEGYSRAFKVLCDEMEIPCILMAGNACDRPSSSGEPHMWNYVQMEDGKWYAIDVTWDDPVNSYSSTYFNIVSGYESHNWFLLGSTSDVGGFSFLESHPEQWYKDFSSGGSYSWELVSGPELAPLTYSNEVSNPYDINHDGVIDEKDINLMAEDIVNDNNSTQDLDGNGRISIGDLVRLIDRYLSK